ICKGIYNESDEISYKKYEKINEHYIDDIDLALKKKLYIGIATHDKNLVKPAFELIEKYKCDKTDYEFQMLLGVTPELRRKIIEKGHVMRVYVPFGKDWFKYSYRRFKENPKMVTHIIKALFIKA
ncbi:proline dehydrogenase family protein, partial [Bacteroidota bacterium]